MIPEDWIWSTVNELCETISVGIVVKPTQYYTNASNGIKAFRSANVIEGRVNNTDWVYITQQGHLKNEKSRLRTGDVLVVRSGAPGTSCVVPPEYEGSNCIDIVFARPQVERILPEYLSLYTNSELGRKQVFRSKNGLALQHFNVSQYKKMEILVPPLKEQRDISSLLETWNTAIEKMEILIRTKSKFIRGLGQQLLTGQRRLKGFGALWHEYYLGDLFSERNEIGYDHLPLLSITRDEGVISRSYINRKDLSSEDKSKYLHICPGDIGYNTMRMWQGVSALSSSEGIVSPAYTICIPKEGIKGTFMAYLFKLPKIINLFYRNSQGLTSDTWSLKFYHFKQIKVTIPNIEEQAAIASILNIYDEEIILLKRQLELFRQQKRGLFQKLLTGEWRVKPTKEN